MSSARRGLLAVFEQGKAGFEDVVEGLEGRGMARLEAVEPAARQILADVRYGGDPMVRRYAERMDGRAPPVLLERQFDGEGAMQRLPPGVVAELKAVLGRQQRFLQRQRESETRYEEGGLLLGQRARPLRRVALLAPPGRAGRASCVLQAGVGARVAGVPDLLLVVADLDDLVLAVAHLLGVTGLVRVGGAQAVAALAFGTQSIPRADAIVGDGGLYASCAKRLVYGHVQVDGLGGPPEVLVLADSVQRAPQIAAELLGVAEQEEDALPLLLVPDVRILVAVEQELARLLAGLPRRAIAAAALERQGKALLVRQREQMLELAERIAPAQLALLVERPEDALDRLRSLGEAWWGPLSSGGGWGGVPPAGGAARFRGVPGLEPFLTRACYSRVSAASLRAQADGALALARAEGREALARGVELRRGLPEAKER
jgi:histidinol dehydrogenase